MPPRKLTPPPAEIFTELEAHLAGTLKPVVPPRHVTQRLRTRIHMPDPRLIAERFTSWRSFFIAIGGTMSVLLLIITVARALFHLVARKT
jgi:hypothetical protein